MYSIFEKISDLIRIRIIFRICHEINRPCNSSEVRLFPQLYSPKALKKRTRIVQDMWKGKIDMDKEGFDLTARKDNVEVITVL